MSKNKTGEKLAIKKKNKKESRQRKYFKEERNSTKQFRKNQNREIKRSTCNKRV